MLGSILAPFVYGNLHGEPSSEVPTGKHKGVAYAVHQSGFVHVVWILFHSI